VFDAARIGSAINVSGRVDDYAPGRCPSITESARGKAAKQSFFPTAGRIWRQLKNGSPVCCPAATGRTKEIASLVQFKVADWILPVRPGERMQYSFFPSSRLRLGKFEDDTTSRGIALSKITALTSGHGLMNTNSRLSRCKTKRPRLEESGDVRFEQDPYLEGAQGG
jgi:hypothetical protein